MPANPNTNPNPANPPADQQNSSSPKGAAPANFTPLPSEPSPGVGQAATSQTGTPFAKIATRQIKITSEEIEKFDIPEEFLKTNPVLLDLILKTESMKDEERKYWFQLLPIMSAEQVKKLQDILQNERDQLAELDAKYAAEITKLNTKPNASWSAEDARKKREKIRQQEQTHSQNEASQEKDILDQLNEI